MSQILIKGKPEFSKAIPKEPYLDVAEFFSDTIQGEGINIGRPATFLRLQGCIGNCHWCDTREVWRYGNPYTITELLDLMEDHGVVEKLQKGQHLVITGGSPLMQQDALIQFLKTLYFRFEFTPYMYIEIENECMIMPNEELYNYIDCWNNSPKLSNSGNATSLQYQPKILREVASLRNTWFKFVVAGEHDWQEIKENYLDTLLISRDQIILMPLGADRGELFKNSYKVVNIAIRENVLYSSREHITLWNLAIGV